MRNLWPATLLLFASLTLGACASAPTAQAPPATATVIPATPTPQPSATSVPATATATVAAPTATATQPAPTASPTPSPEVYWPLDGAPADPGEPLNRRPIVAKIDNFPDARPPTGLSFADVVVEAPAEAGITRFNAVFHHDLPEVIGPIRSARLIDLTVVPWFNGLFLHVGASEPVMDRLHASDLTDLDQFFHPNLYWRSSDRPAPYNMYADPAAVIDYADDLGLLKNNDVGSLLFYHGDPPAVPGDRPGPSVRLNYSPAAQTAYVYNPDGGLYLRSIGGEPHLDAATGQQIAAANIIVMETSVTETDIVEDTLGNLSLQIDTIGSGDVTLFRDGRAMSGTWQRGSVDAMIELFDSAGNPLTLKPGQTWIQIIPAGMPFTN